MNRCCRWSVVAILVTACILLLAVQQVAYADQSEAVDEREHAETDYSEDKAAAEDLFSPLELELLSMLNDARQQQDLSPLQPSHRLAEIARSHAEEMIELDYFSHRSPKRGSPAARVRDAGVDTCRVGENLAGNTCVSHAHEMLLASRAHRANMMNTSYEFVGIAVVSGSRYGKIIVQLFAGDLTETQ